MFQHVALNIQAETSAAIHAIVIVMVIEDVIACHCPHACRSPHAAMKAYNSDDTGSCTLLTAPKDTRSDPANVAVHPGLMCKKLARLCTLWTSWGCHLSSLSLVNETVLRARAPFDIATLDHCSTPWAHLPMRSSFPRVESLNMHGYVHDMHCEQQAAHKRPTPISLCNRVFGDMAQV